MTATLAAFSAAVLAGSSREPPTPGFDLVTCGSTIKIGFGPAMDYRLHSHEVAYGSGSGQQSITLKRGVDDNNGFWTVQKGIGQECKRGSPIKNGKIIRLQHVNTGKWLHSHREFKSPLSNNQEVSGFGGHDETNSADNWMVEIEGGGNWGREKSFRLKHVDTGAYLYSTGKHQFGRPINGQREVAAKKRTDANSVWSAMEGLYVKATIAKK